MFSSRNSIRYLLAASLLHLSGCSPDEQSRLASVVEKPETEFVNYSKSIACSNVQIFKANTVEGIQQVIALAKNEGKSVKVFFNEYTPTLTMRGFAPPATG